MPVKIVAVRSIQEGAICQSNTSQHDRDGSARRWTLAQTRLQTTSNSLLEFSTRPYRRLPVKSGYGCYLLDLA